MVYHTIPCKTANTCNHVQAVGPVALVSLLLSNGLTKVIPAAEVNTNPNHPANPHVQMQYNHAAVQVGCRPCSALFPSISVCPAALVSTGCRSRGLVQDYLFCAHVCLGDDAAI